MNKIILSASIFVAFVLSGFSQKSKPNVIFILADDLGINALNCYGNEIVESPNIDKLFSEGIHFTNAYSNDPTCAPSRAAIITGQYAPRTNIYRVVDRFQTDKKAEEMRANMKYLPPASNHLYSNNHGLDPNNFNLAQVFKSNGYATASYGKWHLGKGSSAMHNIGFNDAIETKNHFNFTTYPEQTDYNSSVYNADYCTNKGIQFMKKSVSNKEPFFLFMPYFLVHAPFHPKKEYVAHFKNKYKNTEYDHEKVIAVLSMIKSLDDSVGELLSAIKELDIEDNTIIVFTSDNGHYKIAENNMFSLPYKGNKGDIWEGGIRIPFIVKWKNKIRPKTISTVPTIHVDLYPTLAALANLKLNEHHVLDGISLKDELLHNTSIIEQKSLVWCYTNYSGFNSKTKKFKSTWKNVLQHKKYKLIEDVETNTYELFNLEKDPLEKHNIFLQDITIREELMKQLARWKKETNLPEPTINPEYKN